MALITGDQFRAWAGAPQLPDALVDVVIAEAEASLISDLGIEDTTAISANPAALDLATGEELRRAQRFLARRNSPEGVMGGGDFAVPVPIRDPDSPITLFRIKERLEISWGVS